MARGWESKAVDDQIADADARASTPVRPALTPAERERAQRRETLQLNRARTLQTLQVACNRRHRALLEETIAALDRELVVLDEDRS
ncbi:MAG: hypothetical protein ABS36_01620 [Acidobacteria bacterium SCN 69-37]|nr:MAG: hypothetical protein ABS36_01620 [Acidobacteria bacterium SCN 69-37]